MSNEKACTFVLKQYISEVLLMNYDWEFTRYQCRISQYNNFKAINRNISLRMADKLTTTA